MNLEKYNAAKAVQEEIDLLEEEIDCIEEAHRMVFEFGDTFSSIKLPLAFPCAAEFKIKAAHEAVLLIVDAYRNEISRLRAEFEAI